MTPKQERFIEEYLIDLNGAAAAVRAGFSKRTANTIASQLLAKPAVAAALRARRDAQAERAGVEAEQVVAELARIAFLSPRALFDADGKLKAVQDLDPAVAATVASIETQEETTSAKTGAVTVTRTRKVKFWNKVEALSLLGKRFGLFADRLRLEGEAKVAVEGPAPQLDLSGMSLDEQRAFRDMLRKAISAGADVPAA